MALMLRLMCPNLKCKAILSVPASARGKNVACRQCGMRVKIPTERKEAPPSSQPAPAAPAEEDTNPPA